ncbi:tetraacyldisaccharide 4'-kinase [Henriciella sp.]|uniref:tetraacyldisaccharide 4'-kinase n=1 Tax=Henriciella sp. TaxID=1968823 RepID=UPI002603E2C2|nr:tetraacyldisaccharide 4'-kinase [Henriciella sp.]
MRPPRFWSGEIDPRSREAAPLTRLLLSPFAALYARTTAHRIKTAEPLKLDIPVVCVGNLTAGGTGKSPVAASLRTHLQSRYPDARIATLSRGYGGRLKGPLKVNFASHAAAEVGDEPLMLAAGGEAWIGADRAAAGQAMQADGVDLIIMDDGHQNPGLQKDVSLVVVDSEAGFGNGFVIPKGPLREPIAAGLARADAVVLTGDTGTPEGLPGDQLPVLRTSIKPVADLQPQPYVAFAGIGRPEKFFDTLEAHGAKPADAVPFPDHHVYSRSDLTYLRQLASQYDAQLITTEKDFVRLRHDQRDGIVTLPIRAEFADTATLDKLLEAVTQKLEP